MSRKRRPDIADHASQPAAGIEPSARKHDLSGELIAILASDGVDLLEYGKSRETLEEAGAIVNVVSPRKERIKSWDSGNWGAEIAVDSSPDIAMIERYSGLVIPGGLMHIDSLRDDRLSIEFVQAFFEAGKPVAAVGHAPWLLAKANVLNGHVLTSSPSLESDICNAGGKWIDQAAVDDKVLITGRNHSDLHTFLQTVLSTFHKSRKSRVKIGPLDV